MKLAAALAGATSGDEAGHKNADTKQEAIDKIVCRLFYLWRNFHSRHMLEDTSRLK